MSSLLGDTVQPIAMTPCPYGDLFAMFAVREENGQPDVAGVRVQAFVAVHRPHRPTTAADRYQVLPLLVTQDKISYSCPTEDPTFLGYGEDPYGATWREKAGEVLRKLEIGEGTVRAVMTEDLLGDDARSKLNAILSIGQQALDALDKLDAIKAEMDKGVETPELRRELMETILPVSSLIQQVTALSQPKTTVDQQVREENERLRAVLQKIHGGDNPCLDQNKLRQWAYEAEVLGRGPEGLS